MLLWAFSRTKRSTSISQGNRHHMESQPSKDQMKSPGPHRNAPWPNWNQLAASKLAVFWPSEWGVKMSWLETMSPSNSGFRLPWDEWQIFIPAVVVSKTKIVHEKVSSSKSVWLTLYSFGFKEPQHRAADRTWIQWCTTLGNGIKSCESMQWHHQWFIETAWWWCNVPPLPCQETVAFWTSHTAKWQLLFLRPGTGRYELPEFQKLSIEDKGKVMKKCFNLSVQNQLRFP